METTYVLTKLDVRFARYFKADKEVSWGIPPCPIISFIRTLYDVICDYAKVSQNKFRYQYYSWGSGFRIEVSRTNVYDVVQEDDGSLGIYVNRKQVISIDKHTFDDIARTHFDIFKVWRPGMAAAENAIANLILAIAHPEDNVKVA